MHGTVRIENERGLSISRRYEGRKNREDVLTKILKRYRLNNYTITIIPDDDKKTGYDIKHLRRHILCNTCCDLGMVL